MKKIKAGDRVHKYGIKGQKGIVVKLSMLGDTAFVKWEHEMGIWEVSIFELEKEDKYD